MAEWSSWHSAMLQNNHRFDEALCGDCHIRRITCSTLSSTKATTAESVFAKVCAAWVPPILMVAHKETRRAITADLVPQYDIDG
jgi:hypothetical protein